MEVDGVSPAGGQVLSGEMPIQTEPEIEDIPQEPPSNTEIEPASPTEPESDTQETGDAEEDKGVLRLLEEGHFKGVADVRLRINFFGELVGAEEKIDGVLDSVNSTIGTLEQPGEAVLETSEELPASVLEAQEQFAQTVNQLKANFLSPEVPSTGALVDGLQSAFDGLVETLQAVLVTDTPAEEPESVEGGGETGEPVEPEGETNIYEEFFENLRSAFTAAMEELTAAFREGDGLPELSEPTGNGVAYDKFLAIYDELRGVEPTGEEQHADEPVDLAV